MWEDVCRRYDAHQIGQYQFEEMKDAIWPNLHALALLRQSINDPGNNPGNNSGQKPVSGDAQQHKASERKSA